MSLRLSRVRRSTVELDNTPAPGGAAGSGF